MRNSEPSARPRSWRIVTAVTLGIYWGTMFVATHVPRVPVELQPRFSDKWQHYLAYALLGALAGLWWSVRWPFTWKSFAMLVAAATLYGAFDEITQPLVGREADLLDWRADVIGAASGLGLFAVVWGLGVSSRRRAPSTNS